MQHVRANSLFKSKRLVHEDPQGMRKYTACQSVVSPSCLLKEIFSFAHHGLVPSQFRLHSHIFNEKPMSSQYISLLYTLKGGFSDYTAIHTVQLIFMTVFTTSDL
jgi:hypothetical protein